MARHFVITDIHGCKKTLKRLLFRVCTVSKADTVYFLGDYINKGPDAKGVIDLIWRMEKEGYNLQCLRGNHEQLLLDLRDGIISRDGFDARGGYATFDSFQVQHATAIPQPYFNWIEGLVHYKELPGYILVHAGLDFSLEDPLTNLDAILNIKDFPVDPVWLNGRKILHGHNPKPLHEILEIVQDPAAIEIPLDAGCVYTDRPGQGFLVALELTNWDLYHTPNAE